jgi:hypothetical protein
MAATVAKQLPKPNGRYQSAPDIPVRLGNGGNWPVPEIGVNSQLQSMAGFDGFTSDRFVAVR